jgi:hypothetical protein
VEASVRRALAVIVVVRKEIVVFRCRVARKLRFVFYAGVYHALISESSGPANSAS